MEDSKGIERYSSIKIQDFSEENFLYDFLSKSYENKIIDDAFLNKVYQHRMKSLQQMLIYYTKDESSSVITEDAEKVLKSIDYTVSIYLKRCKSVYEIIEKFENETFENMLKAGNKIIKINFRYCKNLFEKIQKNKMQFENYSYHDTLDRGFTEFFVMYDDFFQAHIPPCSVDYILSVDVQNYLGVEYVRKYFEALNMENTFCNEFNIKDINMLLKSFAQDCELLLINVFDIVLTNCIGLVLSGSDIRKLNVSYFELEIINNKVKNLSESKLENLIIECADECIYELNIEDEELKNYIKNASLKIVSSVNDAIKLNTLNKVFIEFKEEKKNNIIEFIDEEKLSNKKFRNITERIREANNFEEKLTIINGNIKSLVDLNDMLDSECLFEDEYAKFFESLPKMKIILLSKYIDEYGKEHEWTQKYTGFLNSFSEEEKIYINEIKKKIILS